MKKLMILIMAIAIGVALYEQAKPEKNVYLMVCYRYFYVWNDAIKC